MIVPTEYNTVYLAGAIGGCSYGECTDWREWVKRMLDEEGLVGISPMRAKEFLRHETTIDDHEYTNPVATPKGIATRDTWDSARCAITLMNLLNTRNVSIGSCIEVGLVWAARRPLILVTEPDGVYANHPMIKHMAGFIVPELEEGVEIAKALLLP